MSTKYLSIFLNWVKENRIFLLICVIFHLILIPILFVYYCIKYFDCLLPRTVVSMLNIKSKPSERNVRNLTLGIIGLIVLFCVNFKAILLFEPLSDNNNLLLIKYHVISLSVIVLSLFLFWLSQKAKSATYFAMSIRLVLFVSALFVIIYQLFFGLIACVGITYFLKNGQIGIYSFETFSIIVASATNFILAFFSGIILRKNSQLLYRRKHIILFLRSFLYDFEDEYTGVLNTLITYARKDGKRVMKVGNPQQLFNFDDSDTFFLPTIDWKRVLHRFIKKADIVFLVIDKTPGLVWEIVEHTGYHNKYVFYFRLDFYDDIINNIRSYNKGITGKNIEQFLWCIDKLYKQNQDKHEFLVFYYDNVNCIYSDDIQSILEFQQYGKTEKDSKIKYLKLDHGSVIGSVVRIKSKRDVELFYRQSESNESIFIPKKESLYLYINYEGVVTFQIKDIGTGKYYEEKIKLSKKREAFLNIKTHSQKHLIFDQIVLFLGKNQILVQIMYSLLWLLFSYMILQSHEFSALFFSLLIITHLLIMFLYWIHVAYTSGNYRNWTKTQKILSIWPIPFMIIVLISTFIIDKINT